MQRVTNFATTFVMILGNVCLSVHAKLWVILSMFRFRTRYLNLVLHSQLLAKLQLALVNRALKLEIWRQNLVTLCKMHL